MKKNLVVIEELKKQGKALLDARRDNFVRQSLLSDEFMNARSWKWKQNSEY